MAGLVRVTGREEFDDGLRASVAGRIIVMLAIVIPALAGIPNRLPAGPPFSISDGHQAHMNSLPPVMVAR